MIPFRMSWLLLAFWSGSVHCPFSIASEPRTPGPQPTTASDFTPIGVKECSACHSSPSPIYQRLGVTRFVRLVEAKEWLDRDKHAYAYELVRQDLSQGELAMPERKSNKLSVDISSKLKWTVGDGNFEQKCLTCHVGSVPTASSTQMELQFGVQCETCHGPGSEYTRVKHHQQVSWRAKTANQKSELGMWDLTSPSTTAAVCLSCHLGNINQGRFLTHDMYAAGHPILPPFDLQTFLNAMPPHWKTLQEKPITAKSARSDQPAFELQAEYNLAHFDVAGTAVEIQRAIQGSYEKTRRSMIGGLVANDLGIELIHQAAAEPTTWGDYSIYNCIGCHQELKKKNTQFRTDARIPGRPFPADWLTLEYPAIHVSNRDTQDKLTREIFASFNSVPFGDAKRLNQLSDDLHQNLSARLLDRRNMERRVMTRREVQQWLEFLLRSRHEMLSDYWVAKQTAWMVSIAVDELVEHGELASDSVAPMQKDLRESLLLDLQLPQRQSVLDRQRGFLETARSFDVDRCTKLLEGIVKKASTKP